MANGFGGLYVGTSSIQINQHALDVTANNLTNVNTNGYVRQRVHFVDNVYSSASTSQAIGPSQVGLGVSIGEVIHARDIFLDKAYRTENGRQAFYTASYEAVAEIEDYLQESDGNRFQGALTDLYEACAEFAKDPSDTANHNVLVERAQLFLSRSEDLYSGIKDYQRIVNTKIKTDINRINEIGHEIKDLNYQIQKVEAGGFETAMNHRDERDRLLDELSKYARISYTEEIDGMVKVQIEGVDFVNEARVNEIGMIEDTLTEFITPYWPQLSDESKNEYYQAFPTTNISAAQNSDVGEVKALLLARGDHFANYTDIEGLDSFDYDRGISNSIMMNTQAELDSLVHGLITSINDVLCPNTTMNDASFTATDENGNTVIVKTGSKILDVENCARDADGNLPPQELFVRKYTDRYTKVTDAAGKEYYLYNEEDPSDLATCYTLGYTEINKGLIDNDYTLPCIKKDGSVDYEMGAKLDEMWDKDDFQLNPSDSTPTSFTNFYTKWVGSIATVGGVYKNTAASLESTTNSIDYSRQGVIGVSSDEELVNLIKYQSAYNAASRFINVVSEMIEHLLTAM